MTTLMYVSGGLSRNATTHNMWFMGVRVSGDNGMSSSSDDSYYVRCNCATNYLYFVQEINFGNNIYSDHSTVARRLITRCVSLSHGSLIE